jgi:hypothetical protein
MTDPIIATWKRNVAKSTFSPFAPQQLNTPKERVEVYRLIEGDLIEMSDGLPSSPKWTWPKQGGMVKRDPPIPEGMLYIETLVEPGQWYATILQNGKQIAFYHKTIDKDGKTMKQILQGVDPDGRPFEQIQAYDKQ